MRLIALVHALAVFACCVSPALAQPKADESAKRAPATATPATQNPSAYGDDSGTQTSSGNWAPVLIVTGVEVMRSSRPPQLDVIRVRGLSSTDGWTSPEVVPLSRGPTADGMLELLFVAQPPSGALAPTAYGELDAVLIVEPGHPYRGVRVRGAQNSVSLAQIPGVVDAAPPTSDCRACVGKYFVAKGQSAPAGKTASDVIMESIFPTTVRVIRPNEGIGKLDVDPNRLTLILGADGTIVQALWD